MTKKEKAMSIRDRIKKIAIEEGHTELLKICREFDDLVKTLDDGPPPPPPDDGNHPKKPGNP